VCVCASGGGGCAWGGVGSRDGWVIGGGDGEDAGGRTTIRV